MSESGNIRTRLIVATVAVLLPLFATTSPVLAQSDSGTGAFEIGDRLPGSGASEPGEKGIAGVGVGGVGQGEGYREITWDDLIPPDWLPEDLFQSMFDDVDMDTIDDYDPRAMEIMERIRQVWDDAPVVESLNGQRIRIPGFVVPLEGDGESIHEFLLVPYFGACIHVPPPPANQLIHVMPDKEIPARWNMVPVWVNGVLTATRFNSDMGSAGYQLRGIEVEEYKDERPRR